MGFPRPFGDVLSEFRPLIQNGDLPRNVAVITEALRNGETRGLSTTNIRDQYSIDFVLDVTGVDEFSRSSLQFDEEGNFKGGLIRAGTVKINGISKDEVRDMWLMLLEDRVGLRMEQDDLDIILREEGKSAASDSDTVTPHVFFSGRTGSDRISPLTSAQIIEVTNKIAIGWDDIFADVPTSGRVNMRL